MELELGGVRLVGVSVAGEQTVVQAPGLGVCFDVGLCPRACLAAPMVALSHGHVDHVGGLMYYFAQRHGKRMGAGRVACHEALADPIRRIMAACIEMEGRPTLFEVVAMREDDELILEGGKEGGQEGGEVGRTLRAFETQHTVPSLGFVVLEGGGGGGRGGRRSCAIRATRRGGRIFSGRMCSGRGCW